jgi:hypothetical protein
MSAQPASSTPFLPPCQVPRQLGTRRNGVSIAKQSSGCQRRPRTRFHTANDSILLYDDKLTTGRHLCALPRSPGISHRATIPRLWSFDARCSLQGAPSTQHLQTQDVRAAPAEGRDSLVFGETG